MNVVVIIAGREAIPVRAIPYVAPSGIGAHEIVRFLEGDEYGRFRGVFAYQVQADSAPSRVAPIEWKRVAISLRAFDEIITGREARGDMTKNVGLNQWKKKSIRRIPAGVFVWKDEFTSAHLQAFIQGQVTEQEFKRGDHDPIFQPLIYPPKMRKIVMEGFEGLPLAAIAAPVVSSEPARTTHDGDDDDDDDDSTWDELEPSLYLDKMGAEVLASLYPRGKPTVRLSDERSVALAACRTDRRPGRRVSPYATKKPNFVGFQAFPRVFPSFSLLQAQYGQALQIPRHTNQRPLAGDLVQTAQREAAKAHHRLDDPEHRFDGLLA